MKKPAQRFDKKFLGLMLSAIVLASIVIIASNIEPANAALSVKKGSFTACASFPGCTDTITGVGFQPEALILFANEASNSASYTNMYSFSIGFSDGTKQRSISAATRDNISPTVASRSASNSTILQFLDPTSNTAFFQAQLQSFDTDGFTVAWLTPNGGPGTSIHYIALGGGDLTNVKVGTITSGTSTGNKAYTGVGFSPDFVMFLYDRKSGVASVADHAGFGMGFATSSTERGALMVVSEDDRTTSDTARAQRTDRVIYQLAPSNTANVDAEADFVSFDSDGFTLNWISPDGLPNDTNDLFFYMALKGGRYDVGKFNQKTSTGTQSITGVGFTPTGLLFASFNRVTTTTIGDNNRMSFGFSDGTNEGAIWGGDQDNIASSTYVAGYIDSAKIIRLAIEAQNHANSTTKAEADLQSFDSDGFTLNWTTADTTAREIVYVAFGNT